MMEVSHLLDELNDRQREAVAAPQGSCLVLAGAGSGKTRVLAHRVAWLIQAESLSPYSILAVTFTNKAAAEMRRRIEGLLALPVRGMWIGTFHGLAHRLLRAHWQDAGLAENFQILDADDQLRLVKRVIASLDLDEKKWPARQATWWINSQKDEGLRAASIEHYGDVFLKTQLAIYKAYEEACQRGNMVDFAELLLRAHELWLNVPHLLKHYQDRFAALLVDEFQDTNTIQYAWLRMLAGDRNNLLVVGDDDQSIYGWRGAKIENIQRFSQDFPLSSTIRLEQNYRSTSMILDAANGLINKNFGRLGKELWTALGEGEPLQLYAAYNEIDEARYIVERIKQWADDGNAYSQAAILYRSNAQSRVLEEALLRAQMPYRIYGGQRFFERAEIRNALAYMRLIAERGADAAFERVVNLPPRGIGQRTVQEIRQLARQQGTTLWQAAQRIVDGGAMSARARNAIHSFLELIDSLDKITAEDDLATLVEVIVEETGLKDYHGKEGGPRGEARVENLAELVTAARSFDPEDDPAFHGDDEQDDDLPELTLLDQFLNHAALEAGEGQGDPSEDCVQMMTIHSAKGLEFPLVFLAGMEDGLFPHFMSMEDPGGLEEERRLCYVALTRAMRHLYLTFAESRRINGSDTFNKVSRFIGEMPEGMIEEVRLQGSITRPALVRPSRSIAARSDPADAMDEAVHIQLGQRVRHAKYGEGVVLNCEGRGSNIRIQIRFEEGSKWLMGQASLEQVS
ncbi:MAG: DNA helicase II [Pseudomonadales bacterium]